MNKNLEEAVNLLRENNYSCVFFSDDCVITSTETGIAPLMNTISQNISLKGFSAADKIVGRAAAFLYVKLGVDCLFAQVMSKGAKEILDKNGIPNFCDTLTEKIINRKGTDICPMDKAVLNAKTSEEAYSLLVEKTKSKK